MEINSKYGLLLTEIDIQLTGMSRLLKNENGPLLRRYGLSDRDSNFVNRSTYFNSLEKLKAIAREIIASYCATQFSTSTSAESIGFLFKHRWTLAKSLMKLKVLGIRHFYFSKPGAALNGLAELNTLTNFIAPFRSAQSTR